MTTGQSRLARLACWFLLPTAVALADDSPPLTLADLEAYRVALSARPGGSAPSVRFRDLWDRPEAYLGRPVSVEGRVARLFRQPKVGEFPPLVEAWVVSPSGDPFCLVFPTVEGRSTPEVGAPVKFSGTFLKKIRYHGTDADRLAPLIVGPEAPSSPKADSEVEGMSWSSIDWMMAVAGCLLVGMVLARRHLARPAPPPPAFEPPPTFVDGEPGSDADRDGVQEGDFREELG
jgi:hypothetical protein